MAGKDRKGNKISRPMLQEREESLCEGDRSVRISQRWDGQEQEGKASDEMLHDQSNEGSPPNQTWLPPNPADEIPIMKCGPSSFEELLERELAKDASSKDAVKPAPNSGARTSFLKRGTKAIDLWRC
eukprot:768635-Hanusia_phi.AAC.12